LQHASRASTARRTLDEELIYTDALMRTDGRDAPSHYIGELRRTILDLSIATNSNQVTMSFAQHYAACLVTWMLQDGNSNQVTIGVTCGEFQNNGLLKKATVFYDPPYSAS
jgi:hypothetical protein